jgi:aspartyl-tRNA(Asn)/glutamyl-tRNA(Gln) amidotransferase subunit B
VEPNISVRPVGTAGFGTRTELKNLNSFRALAEGTAYELKRQAAILRAGGEVVQETRGWHDTRRETFSQRSKEEADDYRYFPEPDLPPLMITDEWIDSVRASLPELPDAKMVRFIRDFALSTYDAQVIAEERLVSEWFDTAVSAGGAPKPAPKPVANWMINELFRLMNEHRKSIGEVKVTPQALVELIHLVDDGTLNNNTAKDILAEMFTTGQAPSTIVRAKGLTQISDEEAITAIIFQVLRENPEQVASFLSGKERLLGWFVGQVMKATQGKADPGIVNALLSQQLGKLRKS